MRSAAVLIMAYACWGALGSSLVRVAEGASDVIEVIDFDTAVRTAQGGQFRSIGALPNHLRERLVTIGEPAGGAWRIEVAAEAPTTGIGAIVPLYDTTLRPSPPRLLDVAQAPYLQVRLIGDLGGRHLRIELVPGAALGIDSPGVPLGVLQGTDLDSQAWTVKTWRVPSRAVDEGAAGAIRLVFEGEGKAWFAVESIRFSSSQTSDDMLHAPPTERRPLRQALWVWRTTKILPDPARVERLLGFCKRYAITDLFWQVPYNKFAGGKMELLHVQEQRRFNAAAHESGIRIHALDGAAEFVLHENHERLFKLVEALDRFNREGPTESRYSAVHMDNEPYVLKGWKKDAQTRQKIIQGYIELNRELRKRVNDAGMEYGVDIPFWWDKVDETGKRAFNVHTEHGEVPLLEAIFGLVQNAGIMSYRVRATGSNGVISCCLTEFELGKRLGVDVFASVELGTGPRVEKGITFGVYSADYFLGQLDTLQRVLPHQQGCAGLAIHAYYSFEDILEKGR